MISKIKLKLKDQITSGTARLHAQIAVHTWFNGFFQPFAQRSLPPQYADAILEVRRDYSVSKYIGSGFWSTEVMG